MSKIKLHSSLIALLSAVTLAPTCLAQVVYNTGVDDLGNVLPAGQSDPHYIGFEGPAKVIEPLPGWIPNSTTSAWIKSSKTSSDFDYYYTTFDLTGYDPDNVTVSFKWSVAKANGSVTLNNEIAIAGLADDPTKFTETTLTKGFVPGINGIEFLLLSSNPPDLLVTIGSLRLEGFTINAVPEPETWSVVCAAGLVGFALWRRRTA